MTNEWNGKSLGIGLDSALSQSMPPFVQVVCNQFSCAAAAAFADRPDGLCFVSFETGKRKRGPTDGMGKRARPTTESDGGKEKSHLK